jgi:predicted permease
MTAVLEIVLPIFSLMAAGYVCARLGYLSQTVEEGLTAFVFSVGIPLLLARALATVQFNGIEPWSYWGAYFGSLVIVWIAALLVTAVLFRRDMRTATVAGFSASFSNLVLFGVPLIERAYGAVGLEVLVVLLALHLPTLLTVSTFTMEFAARHDGVEVGRLDAGAVALRLIKRTGRNPIIVGILIGLVWRIIQPPMPESIIIVGGEALDLITRATTPLALFALGMGAVKYGVKGDVAPAAILAVLSVIVLPGLVWLATETLLPLPDLWRKVAVLAAACPTGINPYLFARYFGVAERLTTGTVIIALAASIVTIPFWLWVMS